MTPDRTRRVDDVERASTPGGPVSTDRPPVAPGAEPVDVGVPETTTVQHLAGHSARVGTAPDHIYVQLRLGNPAYVRVRPGDVLYESDPSLLRRRGGPSPRTDAWEVREVTPRSVVGRHLGSGAELEWDRESLERGLAVGRYAVDLVGFESVSVHQVGDWNDDVAADHADRQPYVSVVAYGNNGLQYGQRFLLEEPSPGAVAAVVAPWTEDRAVRKLPPELRERYDERVAVALEASSYLLSAK